MIWICCSFLLAEAKTNYIASQCSFSKLMSCLCRWHFHSIRTLPICPIRLVFTYLLTANQTQACRWWWIKLLRWTPAETSSSTQSHLTVQTGNLIVWSFPFLTVNTWAINVKKDKFQFRKYIYWVRMKQHKPVKNIQNIQKCRNRSKNNYKLKSDSRLLKHKPNTALYRVRLNICSRGSIHTDYRRQCVHL